MNRKEKLIKLRNELLDSPWSFCYGSEIARMDRILDKIEWRASKAGRGAIEMIMYCIPSIKQTGLILLRESQQQTYCGLEEYLNQENKCNQLVKEAKRCLDICNE